VGYLRSPDAGTTWERSDGQRVALPATPDTVTVIASGGDKKAPGLRCGAIAVDGAGSPAILYSSTAELPGQAWIATPQASGSWRKRPLLPEIAQGWPGWSLTMPGGITVGAAGRVYVVLTMVKLQANDAESVWGHSTSEVLWLESADGGATFEPTLLSTPNPACPHWLPNIERPTGHNKVERPGVIYTAGTRGENNRQILSNRVYWATPVSLGPR
jgi:hypothetical protein